ncbi:TonB-linked SusC/RagA family outer membrane protein [Parabacteroides sp. PF5-5]|uniref:SusC/RagA family TonB-linked outer membrane protein n=2 Tax=unclassified Parabacteroides TaxID=2649774 RepID=UPI002475A8DA|nr:MULTISPECIES: TonB-dependent receptor [unclassified Parabacteroides]MDH6315582.1 TonB-linked SusC/RagA family outer membrane protein [Parabacteroides sp. PF5-13]MDH6326775.1 TonB-linked SusC/RagA family outer membrane protein [Parabacteroides sp. PH5-41]MDH6334796.1 TonB-linked SusC/RagA family outer membrane protein [Parabacteroides sp. PF5-5]MDH6345860.1 TonB-linked SusC/RagA family outer membrane protein [Parabacteroides sp. PH5-46]MDH6360816.1 TonB-linked SusC/RagA family outer membrane
MNNNVTLKLFRAKSFRLFREKAITMCVITLFSFLQITISHADNHLSQNLALSTYTETQQQTKSVTGTVTDPSGEPIIGANVIVKGTTNGTITDYDGNFSLEVPMDAVLSISYIGYIPQEVTYTGQTTLTIILVDDTQALDEVVVTALGIKRERRALGYAMQEVKGDQLTETRDANVANALAGKIAGVQINQSGTGVGGGTRIIIRGNNSISGNNQPLIVVDGVPIDNFSSDTGDYWGNGKIDKGSGISDISPDDIESMSVLKGPAAAALYGSRAGNGVVMITTKTGASGKGLGINFNTNLTFESPMMTPDFQNVYGQGSNGAFDANTIGSWGSKLDGSTKEMALGSFAYSARNNDLYSDFLRTGTSWTNSLDISKSSEDMTFRASVSRLDNQSVVPNSGIERTSINLRTTAKIASWLSADFKINYVNQQSKNRIAVAADPNNIFYDYLLMPRSVGFSDWDAYKDNNWKRADGKPASWKTDHSSAPRNPYWSTERNGNTDKRDRYIGFAAFDFTITDWLSLKLRTGMDNYTFLYDWTRATGNPYWETNGSYRVQTERFKELNSDFLFTAQKNWDKFGIVGTVGGNIMYRSTSLNNDFSGELVIPDFYAISNGKSHNGEFSRSRKQINSIYATASMSWDNYLYLDLTGRNDWSSTLPKDNNSYFYPSVGGSWVFSQMLHNMDIETSPLTFGKVRVSWAQVGNDTDPYMLRDYYDINYDIKGSSFNANKRNWIANPDLKNETIESWELGLELRGFDNRVGLDVSYYKKNAKDQILKISVPSATGYEYKMINAGNIQNKGWEVALNATPIKTSNGFTWETLVNWSMNKNKVVELTEGTERQILSADAGLNFMQIVAEVGGSYGDMYGYGFQRDDAGNIVVGESGLPLRTSDYIKLGNNQPKWMLGWSNDFRYKNFSLGFLFDMNYGGDIFMGSIQQGARYGNLKMTLEGREGMVVPGVTQSGAVNTKQVTAQEYYTEINGIAEAYIYDATNIRLREVSFGYSLPKNLLAKTPFTNLKASFVARNLFMIHHKTKGFDPEAGFSNSSAVQGVEFASMPTMRSLGFNISASF